MNRNDSRLFKNAVMTLHTSRLILRALLFLVAVTLYFVDSSIIIYSPLIGVRGGFNFLLVIWFFFAVDIVLRFFPSKYESMGCQKQFAGDFRPAPECAEVPEEVKKRNLRSVVTVAASWLILNAGVAALFFTHVIDEGILLLIALFYSVCDIICILFYCPFQSLFMKNRCCVNCRIYNWDFMMMFTPAILVKNIYTWSLVAMAAALVVRWEITYARHPERFSYRTNRALRCGECREHLCVHKKSIQALAEKTKEFIGATITTVKSPRGRGAR